MNNGLAAHFCSCGEKLQCAFSYSSLINHFSLFYFHFGISGVVASAAEHIFDTGNHGPQDQLVLK
jgi:hypothetical protein